MTTGGTRGPGRKSIMQLFGGDDFDVKVFADGARGEAPMEAEPAFGSTREPVSLAVAASVLLVVGVVSHFGFGSPAATSALPSAVGVGILLSNARKVASSYLPLVLGLGYFGVRMVGGPDSVAAGLAIAAEALALSLVVTITDRLVEARQTDGGPPRPSSHPRVRTFDHRLRAEFQLEMLRSRRFERPLSLLVIQPVWGSSKNIGRSRGEDHPAEVDRQLSRGFKRRLGLLVLHHVRRLDKVGWDREEGRYIVICPETPSAGTQVLLSRIQASVSQHLGASVRGGVASSPEDGFELDQLLIQAELRTSEVFGSPPPANGNAVVNR